MALVGGCVRVRVGLECGLNLRATDNPGTKSMTSRDSGLTARAVAKGDPEPNSNIRHVDHAHLHLRRRRAPAGDPGCDLSQMSDNLGE